MTGFSVDPTSLYNYAGQFIESGAVWAGSGTQSGHGVAPVVAQCNLPADAFGSDPGTWSLSFAWGGQANPGLYAAYHSLWQFLSGVANTAQGVLEGWAENLIVTANGYQEQQNKQTASMSAAQKRLMNLNA